MNNKQVKLSSNNLEQQYSDVEVWWLLLQTGRAMDRLRDRELLGYGITRQEAGILVAIDLIGRQATQAEISRWTMRVSHSISSLVDRMEAKGLLRKIRDLDRRNLARIVMTKKGQEAWSHIEKRESFHRLLSILSSKERQQLVEILFKLRDEALEELRAKTPRFPKRHQMSH